MLCHPLTHVRAGRYRTRTAAEATAACGGNREPRLGPRSDFSKPCQGAAEKSANATRTGASRQIPSRFPTPRNVYRDDCRFVVTVQDSNSNEQRQGIIVVMVSCLLLILTVYGILGLVQQIQVCLPLTMHCRKSPQTVVWGFFICGGWYRMGTASVFPARFSIAFRRKVCFNKKSDTAIRRREKVGAGCSKLRS